MSKKLKFKPVITRVKLNPEQAVLACVCSTGWYLFNAGAGTGYITDGSTRGMYCKPSTKGTWFRVFTSGGTQTWFNSNNVAGS